MLHYIGWCIGECPLYRGVLHQRLHYVYMYVYAPLQAKLESERLVSAVTQNRTNDVNRRSNGM